jgi:hypothetical protein
MTSSDSAILCGQGLQGEHGCATNVVFSRCCIVGTRRAARAYQIPDDGNIIGPTVRGLQMSIAAQEKRLRSHSLSRPYVLTFQIFHRSNTAFYYRWYK